MAAKKEGTVPDVLPTALLALLVLALGRVLCVVVDLIADMRGGL